MGEVLPLIVFDINEVLGCLSGHRPRSTDLEILKLDRGHYFVVRPGCREFLRDCFSKYSVGFFTSMKKTTAQPILYQLLTPDQYESTAFFYYRDRCRHDPDITKGSTIKMLVDIFDNPIFNRHRLYNENNTIICDDSIDKTRFNKPNNVVIVPRFRWRNPDAYLKIIGHTIQDQINRLSLNREIPEAIKTNQDDVVTHTSL
jgi:TFIIF-interacting CTD phosphatase-like protein